MIEKVSMIKLLLWKQVGTSSLDGKELNGAGIAIKRAFNEVTVSKLHDYKASHNANSDSRLATDKSNSVVYYEIPSKSSEFSRI